MRKVLAVMLAVCIMACGISEALAERGDTVDFDGDIIESFPAFGICTGDYVRYRSGPGTRYKVLGRLFMDDEVRVRDSKWVNGDLWYQIDNPKGNRGRVWVHANYIEPMRTN